MPNFITGKCCYMDLGLGFFCFTFVRNILPEVEETNFLVLTFVM